MSDTAARLDPAYDSCLIGATVSMHEAPRFVYSLRKLIQFEQRRASCLIEEARTAVAQELVTPILREHGPEGPVFVDDELVLGELKDPEVKIIMPEFGKP